MIIKVKLKKDDVIPGNIFIFKIDESLSSLIELNDSRNMAYLNLYNSYLSKSIEEFYNFNETKFINEYFKFKKDNNALLLFIVQKYLGKMFDYINNNFTYKYEIDNSFNTLTIKIINKII